MQWSVDEGLCALKSGGGVSESLCNLEFVICVALRDKESAGFRK